MRSPSIVRGSHVVRSTLHTVALAGGALAALAGSAAAQARGEIAGRVTGPGGDPVANAVVELLGAEQRTTTDRAGRFRLSTVPAGARRIVVRYIGLKADTVSAEVPANGAARVDVALALAPMMLSGITVEGERGGQLRAINAQRRSSTVVNAVSADEIG